MPYYFYCDVLYAAKANPTPTANVWNVFLSPHCQAIYIGTSENRGPRLVDQFISTSRSCRALRVLLPRPSRSVCDGPIVKVSPP